MEAVTSSRSRRVVYRVVSYPFYLLDLSRVASGPDVSVHTYIGTTYLFIHTLSLRFSGVCATYVRANWKLLTHKITNDFRT